MSGMDDKGPSKYSMSVSMYRGGARGYGRPRTAPPDLPSLLLDARICYLGMPVRDYISGSKIKQCYFSLHDLFIHFVLTQHFILYLISVDCTRSN